MYDFCECEEKDLIKCNQGGISRTCLRHKDRVEFSLQLEIQTDRCEDLRHATITLSTGSKRLRSMLFSFIKHCIRVSVVFVYQSLLKRYR